MKDFNSERERDFFELFHEYFDLEKDVGKQHDAQNYSLDRMYPLAALAGNPERQLKIIHVAGTKGKGSTCFYLTALLNAADTIVYYVLLIAGWAAIVISVLSFLVSLISFIRHEKKANDGVIIVPPEEQENN